MRIFTLGRKGIPLFFFALLLFSGTSMYGQEGCPTAQGTPTDQTFCYLETVGDIVTDGTAVYRNADSRQPAPANQLLENRTYYIGSSAGNCTNRIAVTVNVDAAPAPETEFGNVFAPCIESEENLHTVAALEAVFEADPGYSIVVFETQFGLNALPEGTTLNPGESYFVGQQAPEACPSLRVAIAYNPDLTEAPVAEAEQTFCLGATVADLQAQGTSPNTTAIRWYSDDTSYPPLESDMQLLDGETYYASQIINDRNSPMPPCESEERVAVTVEIIEPFAGEDNTLTLCQSALQERLENESPEEVFLSLLDAGVPASGSFNPTISELAARYSNNPIGTFATTYTVTNEFGCEDSVELALVVEQNPNAGEDTNLEFCQSQIEEFAALYFTNPEAARAMLMESIGTVDQTGTFSNSTLETIATNFLVAVDANAFPFQAQTVYTVESNGCTDSATINLTVYRTPYAGDDTEIEVAPTDAPVNLFQVLVNNSSESPDTGGTWSPGNGTFNPATDAPGEYTYTVVTPNGCEDSATVTVTLSGCTIDAGADNERILCNDEIPGLINGNESVRQLYLSLLEEGVPTNGTFSPTIQRIINNYNRNNFQSFTTTYTVGSGDCTDSVQLTLTVVEPQEANAGPDTTVSFCSSEGVLDLTDYVNSAANQDGYFEELENNTFDPSAVGAGTYTFTYTVDAQVFCVTGEDSATYTIEVTEGGGNAGEDVALEYCITEIQEMTQEEAIAIFNSLLGDNVDPNGEFSPSLSTLIAQFSQNPIGTFSTEYTVGEGACEDSAQLSVTVYSAVEAGENGEVTLTTDDEPVNLFNYLGGTPDTGGTFSPGNADGSFDPATDAAGVYTYTVTNGACEDTATVTVTIEGCTQFAGADNSRTICNDEIPGLINGNESVRQLYLSLLEEGVPTDGTFSPSIQRLVNNYNRNNFGTFSTTYTVQAGDCVDSVSLSLIILEPQTANAGPDKSLTFCTSEGAVNLADYLDASATLGGNFPELENNMFNPSVVGAGTYTFTYTIDSSVYCVNGEDTATYTVEVIEGGANAGDDVNATYCITEIQDLTQEEAIALFYSLLGEDVDQNGEFSPSLDELIAQFAVNPIGTFTTTYTVGDGECQSSADISVTINDLETANAGNDVSLIFCTTDSAVDLTDFLSAGASTSGSFEGLEGNTFNPAEAGVGTYTFTYTVDATLECTQGEDTSVFTVEVTESANAGEDQTAEICNSEVRSAFPNTTAVRNFYLNFLEDGISRTGTFDPSIESLVARYNSGNQIGDFSTTYTIGNGECQDSVELNITILANPNAGQSATVTLEEGTTETVDLFEALGGTPEEGGVWTFGGEEVDGTFDPATDEEGAYTYTVTSENGCSASAIVTVVIGTQEPNCPEVTETEQTFCGGAPTVADLAPEGVIWYASADATEALDETTVLVDGNLYYAGPVDGTCDDRPSVTVTLSDNPAAPTVVDFNACVVEAATVADLDITVEDGATFSVFADEAMEEPLADTEVLVEGTYFVTQTNAAGCVSEAASLEVSLTDVAPPTLTAGGNEFCEFDGARITDLEENVTATGTIIWYTTATGNQTVPESTVLQDDVTYYAAVTDATVGCESSQRLAVQINLITCELVIPEIFTPNADGVNDLFVIRNISSEYPDHMLEIYNRWGEPVYKGKAGEDNGWNGTSTEGSFGDGVLPVGVYFYILYFNDGQTSPVQGTVYLSR